MNSKVIYIATVYVIYIYIRFNNKKCHRTVDGWANDIECIHCKKKMDSAVQPHGTIVTSQFIFRLAKEGAG